MLFLWSGEYSDCPLARSNPAVWVAFILALAPVGGLPADASTPPRSAGPIETITDLAQIWELSSEMSLVALPLRIEGRVSVYDPSFGNCWIEQGGIGTYVALSKSPPALRAGQHVLIEGNLVPAKGLEAALLTVKVLQEFEPVVPLDTKDRISEMGSLNGRIVSVEGYVADQDSIDDTHVHLVLVVGDRRVTAWVKPDDVTSVPSWRGRFVRLTGMYSARVDATGTGSLVEIWVSRQSDLTVTGSLADYPGFNLAVTPIDRIHEIPAGNEVHVRGRIQTDAAGTSMVVRDTTGQVDVRSAQRARIPDGVEVDVVGRMSVSGGRWIVLSALYRQIVPAVPAPALAGGSPTLQGIDQILQLTLAEAALGRQVKVLGTVVWVDPEDGYFFMVGFSGGIRVRFDRNQMQTPRLIQYMSVEGVTYEDGNVPGVILKRYANLGSVDPPPARPVTFDQAITGNEDSQWVEMRGYLKRTESNGHLRRIYVATAMGEFFALLDSPVNLQATPGSLIRVDGVCDTAEEGGRITGLRLLVPFLHSITVEENAPVDFFDLPLRPIKSLGELNLVGDLTRVRVSGVVIYTVPGRLIYLQDDQAGLMLLSNATEPLAVGDSIEAVGVLGKEGVRTVLREAVYHKLTSGAGPTPQRLSDPSHFAAALDGRLVSIRGTLIDVLHEPQQTRLTLQNGSTVFEAIFDHPLDPPAPARLALGAVLDVAGVYRADFDDSRQLRGFRLWLRSWGDVAVVQGARLWTVQRALVVAALLGIAALLGVMWGATLRRRVRQQTEQIHEQMEQQVRLEAEVQHAARLESLGVLAGGIAHDFNNLLTVVIGNLSLAMLDAKVAESAGGFLQEIEQAAFRARDLTQQLLTFAKGGNPVRTTVALPEIVREAAESMLHGSSVRCEYAVGPGLWSANVDRDQVTQTIQNLALNAVEAMPGGGVIRISLTNEEIASGAHASLAAGRYLRVAVADSGEGIKPEILPRVFDPYFSTKKVGGGLGLATVYSIVKRHGGRIEVESTPGHGATFTLWLPAGETVTPTPPPSAPAAIPAEVLPRSARVLLMDDEESVRRLGAALLLRMGLLTETVADGAAAVKEFSEARSAGHPYDLVILDLTIPSGMGGREAMEHIRKLDPQVPAIVSSGYSNDPVLADFARYGFQAIVPKPYEVSLLMETVKRLLAPRP
jgi:signal transduction histidine kinase/ActR/RegA family two-component response regulator